MPSKIAHTFPLVRTFTGRCAMMEQASDDLMRAIDGLTDVQIELINRDPIYRKLVDALAGCKFAMDQRNWE